MESNSSRHTECVWNEELLSKNLNDEFGIESIERKVIRVLVLLVKVIKDIILKDK